MDYALIIQYVGYLIGVISTSYAIYVKRKLFQLQSRTERAKAKAYRAKTKAEEARQAEHTTGAVKNFIDWFRGNKNDPTGNAEVY